MSKGLYMTYSKGLGKDIWKRWGWVYHQACKRNKNREENTADHIADFMIEHLSMDAIHGV